MTDIIMPDFSFEKMIKLSQSVIWGDMDAFQHVNNTVYFRYFENVRIAYFEETGINQLMQETKIGPILGSTECQYLAPLTYPDEIVIATCVTALKEKRFTMLYEVFSQKNQKISARGTGEIVYFDYNKQRSCSIPETIVCNIKNISPQVM